jgi:hypothetical protein
MSIISLNFHRRYASAAERALGETGLSSDKLFRRIEFIFSGHRFHEYGDEAPLIASTHLKKKGNKYANVNLER